MGRDRQQEIVRLDTAAIVYNTDQRNTSLLQRNVDPRRLCIKRILKQFLDDAGGAFDHLARSDAVDDRERQFLDSCHISACQVS